MQVIGNQALFASCTVITPATPVFGTNSGAFLSVTRAAAGIFDIVMAPDFHLKDTDIIKVNPTGVLGNTGALQETAAGDLQTEFTASITNGQNVAADAPFTLTITRTFRG